MYTRNYYPDTQERLTPPENYDGCAFIESSSAPSEATLEASYNECENSENKIGQREKTVSAGLGDIPFLSGLFGKGSLLGGLNLKMPTIGTEEILILATAAFLFFSRDGDKECAILILILVFLA